MAATRVYVGAHYPVDVLAGLAVGGAVAALTQLAMSPTEWLVKRAESTALRPLLTVQRTPRVSGGSSVLH
jgi:membrane-associated phospholipid phosphatase